MNHTIQYGIKHRMVYQHPILQINGSPNFKAL